MSTRSAGIRGGNSCACSLVLSVAVPIAFIAYADHVRNTTGINWLGALRALVAVALVIATTVIASRR